MKRKLVGTVLLLALSAVVQGEESTPRLLPEPESTLTTTSCPVPTCPPGITPLAVRLVPAEPLVTLRLGEADAHATPCRHGCGKTGGGNIDVKQTAPDTIVVTMTGVGVAGGLPFVESKAGFTFDLCQDFNVVFETPNVCGANLYVQGRIVGLLRNPCKGHAECSQGCVTVSTNDGPETREVLTLCLPGKAICDKDNQSVLVRGGPLSSPIGPGCYKLHQTFSVSASQHGGVPGKPASAEFAPAPALDPSWISYKDPFHGVAKKDLGFQVTLKVVPVKSPTSQPTSINVNVKQDAGPVKAPAKSE